MQKTANVPDCGWEQYSQRKPVSCGLAVASHRLKLFTAASQCRRKQETGHQNALNRIFPGVYGRTSRYPEITGAQEMVCFLGSCDY